jgi:hypothetical protein
MKNVIGYLFALLLCLSATSALAAKTSPTIPTAAAEQAFTQVRVLCEADHGKMWGVSLCGPMLFADPASRAAVLNQPVAGAKRDGKIWRITLPKDLPLSNSAVKYKGQRWSTFLWPLLPKDKAERGVLLMHESFHRIQPALGLVVNDGGGGVGELDSRQGRIWIRGEFHALRAALTAPGDKRKQALTDALTMRVYRHSLFSGLEKQERLLELNEGLANSTGIEAALNTRKARIKAAIHWLNRIEGRSSYVRTFAYATGPAYAELLNIAAPGWRRHVTPAFDFAKAAAKAYGIAMPSASKSAAMTALDRHGGKAIRAQEKKRAQKTAARNKRYKKEFVKGPTVSFPIIQSRRTFNSHHMTQFADHGIVYGILDDNDVWGELKVDGGDALFLSKSHRIVLPVTHELSGKNLSGDGWSATLNDAYKLAPDPDKSGSYVVVKAEPAGEK